MLQWTLESKYLLKILILIILEKYPEVIFMDHIVIFLVVLVFELGALHLRGTYSTI
jgi:hypothetical protein